MKKCFYFIAALASNLAWGQSNMVVTNTTADAVMAGNYNPASYNMGINALPGRYFG